MYVGNVYVDAIYAMSCVCVWLHVYVCVCVCVTTHVHMRAFNRSRAVRLSDDATVPASLSKCLQVIAPDSKLASVGNVGISWHGT